MQFLCLFLFNVSGFGNIPTPCQCSIREIPGCSFSYITGIHELINLWYDTFVILVFLLISPFPFVTCPLSKIEDSHSSLECPKFWIHFLYIKIFPLESTTNNLIDLAFILTLVSSTTICINHKDNGGLCTYFSKFLY